MHLTAILLTLATAPAVDPAREVIPLLQRACFECHGPEKQRGGLRLDSRAALLKGGDSGPALVPGKPDQSELLRRVLLGKGTEGVMPVRGDPLSRAQADVLRTWIADGAPWPETALARHWAYTAPIRPVPPVVPADHRVHNAIDAFVVARLVREKLSPSPLASREVLLRRVTLDLTGLPPTPAEVDTFLADAQPGAYERVVDRLLSSPQFGVRWARPWLDAARYADSHGFQRDDLRDLWPYRDWVVNAFNADMPFDRFTIEQLAGDLLPNPTQEQRIATGFNRSAPTNVEAGSDPEDTRVNQVFDRVNTLGTVWLGTTLECCQCHDHKYDPFSARDYYRLFAFFNSTEIEADRSNPKVPGSIRFLGPTLTFSDPETERDRQAATTRLEELRQKREKALAELDGLPANVLAALRTAPAKRTAEQKRLLSASAANSSPVLKAIDAEIQEAGTQVEALRPVTSLILRELSKPRPTHLLKRGDFRTPGEVVTPGTPGVLPPLPEGAGSNRLDLARWLVAPENPLTARVTVNRLWAELFGRGLVQTPEDFGIKGEPPTHPELLDWLAIEFRDNGWSIKRLLRTIVLSATYQQSSKVTPEMLARDDRNLLLARGPRFRLEAEAIRDNALAIAGLLSLAQGGPAIRPPQPDGLWVKVGGERYDYRVSPGEVQYRRGLYVVWKRGAPYPSFMNFDATNRMACRVQRARTNTPLQALTLLNDPVYVEAAQAFARRVLAETPDASAEVRLAHAFRLALARTPRAEEMAILRRLLDAELAARKTELAAWYAICAALLNLDETITRG